MSGTIGLRIDVDTYRGTRIGVPRLCEILARRGIRGSFFFTVGPDNMGRHLWRLLRPAFAYKMLRTNAASLYGWDIVLRGTLWPGPRIGERLAPVIRAAAEAGHEIGLHAWDHHAWQQRVERWDESAVRDVLRLGFEALAEAAGAEPTCSATPAWRCTDAVLREKAAFAAFRYNSDCRGAGVFTPRAAGVATGQPQVPVNLPTWDEVVGREISAADWNGYLLDRLEPGGYNVLAAHAEVEGVAVPEIFEDFLDRAAERGYRFAPLSDLLPPSSAGLPEAPVVRCTVSGREGWISCRGD